MQDWGINFVRLAVPWEAVEKWTGIYDTDYIRQLEEVINFLGNNGMHVLLNGGIFGLSKQFCGSGIPKFYVDYSRLAHGCSVFKPDLQYFLGLCIEQPSLKLEKKVVEPPTDEICLKLKDIDLMNTPEAIDLWNKFFDEH